MDAWAAHSLQRCGWGTFLTNDFRNCNPLGDDGFDPLSLVCKLTDVEGSPRSSFRIITPRPWASPPRSSATEGSLERREWRRRRFRSEARSRARILHSSSGRFTGWDEWGKLMAGRRAKAQSLGQKQA